MRILAVDDEPLFLEVLEIALRDLGFNDVTPIYSAKEALRELEFGKKSFDCILLDIRMPGMSGVELCEKIRAVPGHKRTPIMMVTSLTDREYIDGAFGAGASDYLTKPLDSLELKARMSMIERLITEQARNTLLDQLASGEESDDEDDDMELLEFAFDEAVPVAGLDRLIELHAMENYLSRLTTKESYNTSVFAVAIDNAAEFYEKANRYDFMNMLHDVGVTLETVLKRPEALICYAGRGVFAVASTGTNDPDLAKITTQIEMRLGAYSQIYLRDNLPAPAITLGPVMRKTLFTCPRNSDVLRAAIAAAEQPSPILLLPENAKSA
ncbi:response regulator [Xinfangfangia sp. CPCC 101601]|uniref:Response regulator n=1 Tax=Pseudogemmobacter lacusdianii TaxID=3069608 RepID=A0ABU0VTP6_9RHOB|nr:response regulator [Xinfangfangia sp. CPCC 101601]MDQ2065088.1 response regulator [Xinfangfangia sp. CPCC 101601]